MRYMTWYEQEECLHTADGRKITVLRLDTEDNDEILDEWAEHFRNNYRTLEDLDFDIEGTGKTRENLL